MPNLCMLPLTAALLLIAHFAEAQNVTLPAVERVVLANGTVLILNEKHDVPMIGLEAVLRGGGVADPPDKRGLASLFAALIAKGAGDRGAAAFAEAIDSVGGTLSASAEQESISISGEFLSRNADLMVELLTDMLQRPALDRDELSKIRERKINTLLSAKDSDPGRLLPIYGSAFLFGEHPYGNSVGGSESSLAAITHADVRNYYEQQIGADRLIIVVSGDFDAADMQAKLDAAFRDWRPAAGEVAEIMVPAAPPGGRVLLVDKPGAAQTYFWLGSIGVARSYEHRPDLDLANTVFGGRFTSMLNTALRIESGLTYGARSTLTRLSLSGSVAIYSFTETGATEEAIDMSLGILSRLHDSGVNDEMISSARNYVLGQFPMAFETASQLAGIFASLEANGLDRSYIDDYGTALTGADVASIASVIDDVYPHEQDLVFVVLGDADAIRETVGKYGEVTEMSIMVPSFRP